MRYVPALPLPDGLKQYMLFSEERLADAEDDVDDDDDESDRDSSPSEDDEADEQSYSDDYDYEDDFYDEDDHDDDSDVSGERFDSGGKWLRRLFLYKKKPSPQLYCISVLNVFQRTCAQLG